MEMTDHLLIRSKVTLPRRPSSLLTRPRLHQLFDRALDHRLALLRAPAGYGKTSALVDWAHQTPIRVCWYALDETDRDPQQFLTHFLGAIAQRHLGFGATSYAALRSAGPQPDPQRIAQWVVNDVDSHVQEPIVLVLDDYHLVSEESLISRFMSAFLRYAGDHCHVVLAFREHIHLEDLTLLTARSQSIGWNHEDLAFTAEEIRALLLQNYKQSVPAASAAELAEKTEGWITGLLLADPDVGISLTDRVRTASATDVGLHNYLAQQILDHQPPEIRSFLLRSSLLETFDADLCRATFGADEDWPALIRTIRRRNLFAAPVDNTGGRLRYHRLFQDFLQATMRRESPGAYAQILQRLASVYTTQQRWARAYGIYQHLEDADAIVALMAQAGSWLIKHGQFALLARWLDDLAEGTLRTHPTLISLQGVVTSAYGDVEAGLSLQSQALDMLTGEHPRELLARIRLRRASDLQLLGRYQAALRDVEVVFSLTSHSPNLPGILAEALRLKGAILITTGYVMAATWWLENSLQAFLDLDDLAMVARVRMELAVALEGMGRYKQARRAYEQSLAHWQHVGNLLEESMLLNNLAVVHAATGDYVQAGALLGRALAGARRVGYAYSEALTLASLGDLCLDLKALGAAEDAYAQAQQVARTIGDRSQQIYVGLAQAGVARLRGDLRGARRQLQRTHDLLVRYPSPYAQGLYYLELGRQALADRAPSDACAPLERAVLHLDSGGQRAHSDIAQLYLAAAYCGDGRHDQAVEQLRRVFDRDDRFELSHRWLTLEQTALAQLQRLASDPDAGCTVNRLLEETRAWHRQIPAIRRRMRESPSAIPFAPPWIAIRAFGDAEVIVDGRLVTHSTWSRLASRDLLFCLLAHPGGLARAEIGLLLWPDSSERQLNASFKKVIDRLRQVLGQDVIVHEDGIYRFDGAQDYVYDVSSFETKVSAARALSEPEHIATSLQQALALYQGPYLPKNEASWVEPERERLRLIYVGAALDVAAYHLEHQEPDEALSLCNRLLTEDPAMEPAHRLAMRAHAAGGDRGGLVRQYERCRQALRDELDVALSPETEELFEHLRR